MSELIAYHEAGHAVMAIYLGGRVASVTIDPDRDDGPRREGDVQVAWPRRLPVRQPRGAATDHASELRQRSVMVALAGPVAEMIHTGDPFHPGLVPEWRQDWQTAWDLAAKLVVDEQRRLRLLEQLTREIYHLFSRDELWQAIAALVDELLAHETLDEEQAHEAVERWLN